MLQIKIIILSALASMSFAAIANEKPTEKVGIITCVNAIGETFQTKASATEYIIMLAKNKSNEKCVFTEIK